MSSYSRLELLKKFKKEIEVWKSVTSDFNQNLHMYALNSTHIQLASVDEMMSAYGYAPRRLANHPDVLDGRFGYYYVGISVTRGSRGTFMSFEDAVRMHNGGLDLTPSRKITAIVFARKNRIVEQVSLQRTKRGGVKAQTVWVKFCEGEE